MKRIGDANCEAPKYQYDIRRESHRFSPSRPPTKEATMNDNQALLTIHKMQSNLWGMQEANRLKRQAGALLSTDDSPAIATIVTCPDCEGLRYHEKQCDCYPNPNGCSECGGKGWTALTCNTCNGEGQVLMYKDGHTEALV